jgi:peptide/nickel transport system permease protein
MNKNKLTNSISHGDLGNHSYFLYIFRNFKKDKLAMVGLGGIIFLVLIATFAPAIANSRPLCVFNNKGIEFPFFYYLFSPNSSEVLVEKTFNFLMLYIILSFFVFLLFRKLKKIRFYSLLALALLLAIPFFTVKKVLDKTDWQLRISNLKKKETVITAPVPYGPFDIIGSPYETSSKKHLLGTDNIGRDVLSRIIYGTRVSIAVGVFATLISIIIGTSIGLISGYFGGITDLLTMRVVEIIICFPTFLLLLILMATMMDLKFEQSILIVVPVIGFLSWTGLSRIIRGEVLKQRSMQYVQACEALGMSNSRIMFVHLLPNVNGPILVSAVFMVAANVLAESGLSFLGFGVQPPTASWGELLKEAFADPLRYWNLTLWPGLLIFFTVLSFNLVGEGLRKSIDSKSK